MICLYSETASVRNRVGLRSVQNYRL